MSSTNDRKVTGSVYCTGLGLGTVISRFHMRRVSSSVPFHCTVLTPNISIMYPLFLTLIFKLDGFVQGIHCSTTHPEKITGLTRKSNVSIFISESVR